MILSSSLFTTAILSIELRMMLRRRRKGEVVQSSKQVSTKQLNKMSLAERQISIEMDAERRRTTLTLGDFICDESLRGKKKKKKRRKQKKKKLNRAFWCRATG